MEEGMYIHAAEATENCCGKGSSQTLRDEMLDGQAALLIQGGRVVEATARGPPQGGRSGRGERVCNQEGSACDKF